MAESQLPSTVLHEAELQRVQAETTRIKAETAQLLRPWYLHPGVAGMWLGALASLFVFLGGWLGGYFDRRRADLAEQRATLQQDVNSLKADLSTLQSRELQYKQLIQSNEVVLREKERQLFSEKNLLQQEVDLLSETKKSLEQSAQQKARETKAIEDVLSSGGAIEVVASLGQRQFQIRYTSESQTRFALNKASTLAVPLFPFVKLYTHGTINLGDSLLEKVKSKDVTTELETAVAVLHVKSIFLESDYFVVGEQCLERIRESSVSDIQFQGAGCTDAWIDAIKGSKNLKSISLHGTSVTPESVSELISATSALDMLSYRSNNESIAGLLSDAPYRTIRHLDVACKGGLDPMHLAGFDRLISLSIASNLVEDSSWPQGLATHAKYLSLPTLNANWVGQLIGLNSVRVLSFQIASEAASEKLNDVLPRFTELIELDVNCVYNPFPLSSLSNCRKLKTLSINHAKLVGRLAPVSQIASIETLLLHGSPFDPAELEAIAKLPQLRTLDLSNLHNETMLTTLPRMEIANLESFESATQIEEIRLDGNTLATDAIGSLKKMKWLKILSLSTNSDADQLRDELVKLLEKTTVYVDEGPFITFRQ